MPIGRLFLVLTTSPLQAHLHNEHRDAYHEQNNLCHADNDEHSNKGCAEAAHENIARGHTAIRTRGGHYNWALQKETLWPTRTANLQHSKGGCNGLTPGQLRFIEICPAPCRVTTHQRCAMWHVDYCLHEREPLRSIRSKEPRYQTTTWLWASRVKRHSISENSHMQMGLHRPVWPQVDSEMLWTNEPQEVHILEPHRHY
mmetsp:Transcript_106286/g.188992  ORF Transcript_106286/g.188992 Transcript_106286/m.188992 type:complete len:200 (+) Transcript_106286:21-620(+)